MNSRLRTLGSWSRRFLLALALLCLEAARLAHAQVPPSLSQFDQSRERPKAFNPPSAPFNFRLQSPERSPIPRAIDSIKFRLGGIRFEGSSVFEEGELVELYKGLYGTEIVLEDIRKIADQLEEKYKRRGYFLTRVFLPPQQVKDGWFTIKIIEGYIGNVEVEGGNESTRNEVLERLQSLVTKRPIDLASVERALLLLNDLPDIQGSGLLRAGRSLGESSLIVQLEEVANQGLVTLNNQSSAAVGPVMINLAKQIRALLTSHDELSLQVGSSGDGKELLSASMRYALPISRDGLTASFGTLVSRVRPAGLVKLQSDVVAQTLRLRYPLVRTRDGSLFVEAGNTVVTSHTQSDGSDLYNEWVSTRDAALQVVDLRSAFGTTQASLGVSRANSVEAPLPSVSDYDTNLQRLTYSLKHLAQTDSGYFGQLEGQGQWAGRPLLNSERIGFGGGAIGRGYAPSTIVGDRGLGGSLELGLSRRMELPYKLDEGVGQFYFFRDYAVTEKVSVDGSVSSTERISSRGLGVRWQSVGGSRTQLYIARPNSVDGVPQAPTQRMYLNFASPW